MILRLFGFFALISTTLSANASDVEMWRLDCGEMRIPDISYFSDTFEYEGQGDVISNGCYLVRNGDRYLLWDLGLAEEYLGNTEPNEGGWTNSIRQTIEDQLDEIGLSPGDIDYVAISHFHGDHIGQAAAFSESTLLMNSRDVQWILSAPPGNANRRLAPWLADGSERVEFDGDHDVFGDGSVTILALPGHTPGHSGLLVSLAGAGPILLTGDLYHYRSEIGEEIVSQWNHSRADTLASFSRFLQIVSTLNPRVIVQHDPEDIGRLPSFPASER